MPYAACAYRAKSRETRLEMEDEACTYGSLATLQKRPAGAVMRSTNERCVLGWRRELGQSRRHRYRDRAYFRASLLPILITFSSPAQLDLSTAY
jgi:hypothetical protein